MKNPIALLRITALIEAASFLVLLGIAMPLKYVWGMPLAVRVVGSVHGALFLAFCGALFLAFRSARWPVARAALFFVASFLPFVPFFLDGRLRAYATAYEGGFREGVGDAA